MPNFTNKRTLVFFLGGVLLIMVLFMIFLFTRGGDSTTAPGGSGDPFGNLDQGGNRPVTTTPGDTGSGASATTPVVSEMEKAFLFQISTEPVIGFTTFTSANVTFARFIDRATGHIFETGLQSVSPVMVSNVTIPRVQQTDWRGDSILFQYLRDDAGVVRTFFGALEKSKSTEGLAATIGGFFVDDNSAGSALRPDGGALFSLVTTGDGATGSIVDKNTRAKNVIFASPLREWRVTWPASSTLALTSKFEPGSTGMLFLVNARTGASTRTITAPGLSTLTHPFLTHILYTHTKEDIREPALTLSVRNQNTGQTTNLSQVTLPEKCVWSQKATSTLYCFIPRTPPTAPDQLAWYKGTTKLSDNLWKLDVDKGTTALLAIPLVDARTELDATNPMLSLDEKYLLFRNKNDGNLFGYRLPSPPLATSTAE